MAPVISKALRWLLPLCAACQPLPPSGPADAGMADLRGVTFQRIKGARVQASLKAPAARVALDGREVRLRAPEGTVDPGEGQAPLAIAARDMRARPAEGMAEARDVTLRDDKGHRVQAPRVRWDADGGAQAEGPVTFSGGNFVARAAAARWAGADAGVEFTGPVEGEAWPPDGGGSSSFGGP